MTGAPATTQDRPVAPGRVPAVLGRCDRCGAMTMRRPEDGERLCGPCDAGVRAVAQARSAESDVRARLYRTADERDGAVAPATAAPAGRASSAWPRSTLGSRPAPAPVSRSRIGATPRRGGHRPEGDAGGGRPLRIALLAPPWLPVPPTAYGGIENVVALLAGALVDRGHDVTLLAAPGSRSRARVLPLLERLEPDRIGAAVVEADHVSRAFAHVEQELLAGRPYDVLHDHAGWTALAMADRVPVPVVHTVHGSFDEDARRFYGRHGRRAAITCISKAQAGTHPDGLEVSAVVPNPIDVDAWPTGVEKGDHLLWVGRICPEKGPHRAIRVARATGRRLVLAGPVQPGQERFFAEAVEPHLDGDRIVWIGEVGGAAKAELFASARAFLMPITWPEPFGMVMIEAMAAGTPVIAFPHGAAPEVVEAGRSGLLVGDEDAMAEAVAAAEELDPEECRASARERFSPDGVARRYEEVYRGVAVGNAQRPGSVSA